MAAGAATFVITPDHRSGTTWRGFSLLIEDADDEGVYAPRDLTDFTAAAQFRDELGTVLMSFTLGSGIEIPDPETGEVFVEGKGVLTAAPGRMVFDLKLTHPGGEKSVELDGWQQIIGGVTA